MQPANPGLTSGHPRVVAEHRACGRPDADADSPATEAASLLPIWREAALFLQGIALMRAGDVLFRGQIAASRDDSTHNQESNDKIPNATC
jgi:hypothetical protein